MGCDIHLALERHIEGTWHCIWDGEVCPRVSVEGANEDEHQFPIARRRDYNFFGRLAGVRCDGPDAKGLPDDLSVVTANCIKGWGLDGHSHSWATLEEFCRMWAYDDDDMEKVEFVKATLTETRVQDYADYLFGLYSDQGLEDVRVIYWFDN